MAVAFSVSSESHTGTSGSTSQASFSWSHAEAGTPAGVLVFVHNASTATDAVNSVVYGTATLTRVTGGAAIDTTSEPGRTDLFYLGDNVPAGAQTITVNRANNTQVLYATAATVTAATIQTEPFGIVLLQNDGTLAEQSVNDGSPGSDSLRFAAVYSGLASPPAAGASSTLLQSIDFGNNVCAFVRETTAGQGARSVGFSSGTSDDRAAVHFAVREVFDLPFVADRAAFIETFNDAGLNYQLKLVADSGSFNDTFNNATIGKAFIFQVDRAQFAASTQAANLNRALRFTADRAAFNDSFNDVGLNRQLKLVADSGSFNDTFNNATIRKAFIFQVDRAQFAASTQAANLNRALRFTADRAQFNESFNSAGLVRGLRFVADRGLFSLTGNAANLGKGFYLAANRGQFTSTASAAGLRRALRFTADRAPLALTGQAAALAKTFLLPTTAGAFGIAGGAAAYLRQLRLLASRGQYNASGSAASLQRGLRVAANRASFALSGNSGIRLSFQVLLPRGNYNVTGQIAFLDLSADTLTVGSGSFAVSGGNLALAIARVDLAKRARYEFSAANAPLLRAYRLSVSTGTFTSAGQSVLFVKSYSVDVAPGAFAVTGQNANTAAHRIVRFSRGAFSVAGGAISLFKIYRLAVATSAYAYGGANANILRFAFLSVSRGQYLATNQDAGLQRLLKLTAGTVAFTRQFFDLGFRNNPGQPAAGQPRPIVEQPYGGSSGSAPSFLRPEYTRYNSVNKAKDLGLVDNLLATVQGQVGTQSGSNTIYLKIETTGPAQLQIQVQSTNSVTDRYLSTGLLDAERKPIPLDATGSAQPSQTALASPSPAIVQLPGGTYYFTISNSQWQAFDYRVLIKVARYISLAGIIQGTAPLRARLAMARLTGIATLTAPVIASMPSMASIKSLTGVAGGQLSPRLTLGILRGTALLQMNAYGRLKQTHRITGAAVGSNTSTGTLTSSPPYGGGYGY